MTAPAPDEGLRAALARLCDEAEYVVLATDDPGCPPVKAVAVIDLRAVLAAVGPDSTGGQGESVAPLESWHITQTCRLNRGAMGAWTDAVGELAVVYGVQQVRFPRSTFVLSLTRQPVEEVDQP